MATIRPWNFGGILSKTTTTTKWTNERSSHCNVTKKCLWEVYTQFRYNIEIEKDGQTKYN